MAHNEKLYKKCMKIYEADGQHAVIEYCNKIEHKTWGKCKPCDHDQSPLSRGTPPDSQSNHG